MRGAHNLPCTLRIAIVGHNRFRASHCAYLSDTNSSGAELHSCENAPTPIEGCPPNTLSFSQFLKGNGGKTLLVNSVWDASL
jgi:hypothetical protein